MVDTRSGGVSESNQRSGDSGGTTVAISTERFHKVATMAGLSNGRLANGTSYSRGYVGQVRSGRRTRVSRMFLREASRLLAACLGETEAVMVLLIEED